MTFPIERAHEKGGFGGFCFFKLPFDGFSICFPGVFHPQHLRSAPFPTSFHQIDKKFSSNLHHFTKI